MNLTHDPDDDDAARDVIEDFLRRPRDAGWAQLMSDTYVRQTHRVLRTMEEAAVNSRTHRNEEISALRQKFLSGDLGQHQYQTQVNEYSEWRKRVTHFETVVREKLRQAADRANHVRGYTEAKALKDTLSKLARAVSDHRAASESAGIEPEPHDRLLWLRLQTLTISVDQGLRSIDLDHWIKDKERTSPRSASTNRIRRTGRKLPGEKR